MAHADYDCCAICDSKMRYAGFDSQTKEGICTECLKALRDKGINVLDVDEFKSWIKGHDDPEEVQQILKEIGYSQCCYGNDLDDLITQTVGYR